MFCRVIFRVICPVEIIQEFAEGIGQLRAVYIRYDDRFVFRDSFSIIGAVCTCAVFRGSCGAVIAAAQLLFSLVDVDRDVLRIIADHGRVYLGTDRIDKDDTAAVRRRFKHAFISAEILRAVHGRRVERFILVAIIVTAALVGHSDIPIVLAYVQLGELFDINIII